MSPLVTSSQSLPSPTARGVAAIDESGTPANRFAAVPAPATAVTPRTERGRPARTLQRLSEQFVLFLSLTQAWASVPECSLRISPSRGRVVPARYALAATKALDGVVLGRVSPAAGRARSRCVSPRVRVEQSGGSAGTNDRGTEASLSKERSR